MQVSKALLYLKNTLNSYTKSKSNYKPRILSYLITNLCNSHCVTCNAWRSKDLISINVDKLKETLKNPLFNEVQHVGISGGEPSTFNELLTHIDVIMDSLPKLKTISITSNCIKSDFWIEHLLDIKKHCQEKGICFQMNISLDGIGKMHDIVRGTKGNFDNTLRVIDFVSQNDINYQLHTTISKSNVYHVNEILSFAKQKQADIIFRLASRIFRLDNEVHLDRVSLNDKELSFICDFFSSSALLDYTKSPGRRLFYKFLVNQILGDGNRLAPCYFKHQGIVLASDGSLSFCSRFNGNFGSIYEDDYNEKYYDRKLFDQCCNGVCANCYHDQTGLWPLHNVLWGYFGKYFTDISKTIYVLKKLTFSFLKPKRAVSIGQVTKLCVIGMYGGEHVGDAAILGGSILRTIKRYPNIKEICIYSFRSDRTRCWVDNLTEIPESVKIFVQGNEKLFAKNINNSDLLVWAGGPVMELPVVLSRNYSFIRQALAKGVRFEMVGIGYGPINTKIGSILSMKIINAASYVTVRSEADRLKMAGLKTLQNEEECVDPAFSYLAMLPSELNIEKQERISIDRMLEGVKDKVIAINLRPLWSRYGNSDSFNFDTFINEVVSTIEELSRKNYTFVFFPMNSDQYGFSDLEIAYEIKRKLNKKCDYRIWETEPTINGVIYLLRKVDASICMRFHAVVFSLSQKTPVIGIDYSLSGKGKVSTLFQDDENVVPMKDFHAECIVSTLNMLIRS